MLRKKMKIKIQLILIATLSIYILSPVLLYYLLPQLTDRGLFGDSFGAINTLFSAFAFIGIIIAIFYQKEELELQREEIAQNRKELERQADALEKSLKLQSATSMLNVYSIILDPQSGLKNRIIADKDLNEDKIKNEFLSKLSYIEQNLLDKE